MTTALVVVDALNDFLSRRGKGWPMLRDVATEAETLAHLRHVVSVARDRGVPVVHAPHRSAAGSPRPDHPTPNQELARLSRFFSGFGGQFHPELAPRDGEVVASPHGVSSAFGGTDLAEHLQGLGADEIVVCGLLTNTCIESTVRHGVDLGFRVIVVVDAAAAWTRADHRSAIDGSLRQVAHALVTTAELVA